ncbi:MAG: hypothetical protein KIT62_03560 [Cyclobacteriaceae bacterium]|nr:hypothetical protein [Cyclobacteriaceae bacterium]
MKRLWLIVVVAMACQAKKTTTEVLQLSVPAAPPALISIDTASQIISDYLTNPRIDLSQRALGGVFPVSDFTPDAKNEGLLMWYCFDAAAKQLFMAIEPYLHYDAEKLPRYPIQLILRRPVNTYLYNGASPTEKDVKDFLLNQKLIGTSADIDNATATRYVKSFDSLMNTMVDASGQRYQEYPFNYFIWGADYKTFISWAGADGYIRYDLAFNDKDKPNRVRIVLIATDKDGNTVTGAQGFKEPGGQGIQNGWPPPP